MSFRALAGVALAVLLVEPTARAEQVCNIVGSVKYGDCEGVSVVTDARPRIIVTGYSVESGMVAGAEVRDGGTLKLDGLSTRDIEVEAGGTLVVGGSVNGAIVNNGGSVVINGTADSLITSGGEAIVRGAVGSVSGGPVTYGRGAIVGGAPVH